MIEAPFRKSSYCTDAGSCVEVSVDRAQVRVRDNKDVDGGICGFTPVAWAAFVAAVKRGAFTG